MKLAGFFFVYALLTFCISSSRNPSSVARRSSTAIIGCPFCAFTLPNSTRRLLSPRPVLLFRISTGSSRISGMRSTSRSVISG